jgi:hydroxymethylbilane synthase
MSASESSERVLRLGTRGSLLAKAQSQQVANALEAAWPGLRVELVTCVSTGDKIQDKPLHDVGGKGLFTKDLEEALLRGEFDFAVHSLKDVPVTMPLVDTADLVIAAVPKREDPRDVLVTPDARSIADLKPSATVGTGSLRRRSQLLSGRPDLGVELIRGNIDTRLRKLREGQYDAIVLAMAGVRRAGLYDESLMAPIPLDDMLPAAGQGALALQCRRDAARVRELLAKLDHPASRTCVELERGVVLALNGDCHSPIAALATIDGDTAHLRARVGGRDGAPRLVSAVASAPVDAASNLVTEVEMALKQQGAERLLGGTG